MAGDTLAVDGSEFSTQVAALAVQPGMAAREGKECVVTAEVTPRPRQGSVALGTIRAETRRRVVG